MEVMTAPGFWSGQDRMLTVEDMTGYPTSLWCAQIPFSLSSRKFRRNW